MNSRFVVSMGISIIALAVGFYLLYDIQQETESQITQISLDQKLTESQERLSHIKNDFYNGKYNGDLTKDEVVKIINQEVEIQKKLLEQYKELPTEVKTDKTIDTRFFQLSKYSWAGEESLLNALEGIP